VEPSDIVKALTSRWKLIAATVAVAVAIVWFTTPSSAGSGSADSYTATATLVREPGAGQPPSYMATFVTQGEVPRKAARKLGYTDSPALLAQSVEVTADDTIGTLTIEVSDSSAERATEVDGAFLDALTTWMAAQNADDSEMLQVILAEVEVAERKLIRLQGRDTGISPLIQRERLQAARSDLESLYEQRDEARTAAAVATTPLRVVEPATVVPDSSTGFSPPSSRAARALLVGVGAFILACAGALLFARLDTRLRRRSEVQAAFGLPVLAEIPSVGRWKSHGHAGQLARQSQGGLADAYRSLRSSLLLTHPEPLAAGFGSKGTTTSADGAARVIVLTSATSSEGTTTTTVHLASRLAEAGRRVLVIDCDLSDPRLHECFDVPQGSGVMDLQGRSGEAVSKIVRATSTPGVSLIQAGMADRPQIVLPLVLPHIIREARKLADIVLIDCPPALAGTEAMDAMANADAVLVVCRSGRTTREQAERVRELLTRLQTPTFGVALVGAPQGRMAPQPKSRGWWPFGRRRRDSRVVTEPDSETPDQPEPADDHQVPVSREGS
jgi:Mrp family chromosome partitioning ATPase/capsular polysaccharide biosynthesis protein